jgi:hypothetical protein
MSIGNILGALRLNFIWYKGSVVGETDLTLFHHSYTMILFLINSPYCYHKLDILVRWYLDPSPLYTPHLFCGIKFRRVCGFGYFKSDQQSNSLIQPQAEPGGM